MDYGSYTKLVLLEGYYIYLETQSIQFPDATIYEHHFLTPDGIKEKFATYTSTEEWLKAHFEEEETKEP